MTAGIYARVSTLDQEPENQLQELRRYVEARGWQAIEYTDHGVSGAKDRRPALDALLRDARKRKVDVLVCWRLDRLGRNLRHLVNLIDELGSLGIGFTSLGEGIDTQTPSGRLQLHILAALAEFERERIRERVMAGLQRARLQGKRLGRPVRKLPAAVGQLAQEGTTVSIREAAKRLGVSRSTAQRWLATVANFRSSEPVASRCVPEPQPFFRLFRFFRRPRPPGHLQPSSFVLFVSFVKGGYKYEYKYPMMRSGCTGYWLDERNELNE